MSGYDPGTWECPCPECNGRYPGAPDEDDAEDYDEPEHPENVAPEREGYDDRWPATRAEAQARLDAIPPYRRVRWSTIILGERVDVVTVEFFEAFLALALAIAREPS
jgi:hypothetical protein